MADREVTSFVDQHRELLSRISPDELVKAVAKENPSVWAQNYRRIKGKPMRFVDYENPHRHRPFLEMPLVHKARHKTALKARQMGYSEIFFTEAFWAADTNPGTKWVYCFPRNTQLETFSKTRISTAISESPYLRAKIKGGQDNVYLKQIGNSFIVLRSAWDPELGESVDADGVYFDEKDRMQSRVEVSFEESLSSSKFAWRRDISTPSLPGRGVDETFQKSTQYYWFVRCEACGHRQALDRDNLAEAIPVPLGAEEFPDGSYEYRCKKCSLPRLDRWHGEWVAKYPGKDIAGWSMSQLMCFESGTSILMGDGTSKFIEDVCGGDTVITHLGRVRTVVWTKKRSTDFCVKLKTAVGTHTWVTPEHPYFVVRSPKRFTTKSIWRQFDPREGSPEWMSVGDVVEGDWLCYPKLKPSGDVLHTVCDDTTAFVLGLYAAEGWRRRNEFGFCFHKDEFDLVATTTKWLDDRDITYRVVTDESRSNIVASSKQWAGYFNGLCGTGAINKRLPEWVFSLDDCRRHLLLSGLFKGDGGSYSTDGKTQLYFTTTSLSLAYAVQRLLSADNIYAGVSSFDYKKNGIKYEHSYSDSRNWNIRYTVTVNQSDCVVFLVGALGLDSVTIPTKSGRCRWKAGTDYLFVRVVGVNTSDERRDVYNFEVEDDHSYVANSVVAHNCVWISPDEIMRKRMKYKHDDLWVRYVLGLPYSVGGGLASKEHFLACMTRPDYSTFPDRRPPDIRRVVVGIDWGHYNWLVLRGLSRTGVQYLLGLYVFVDTEKPLEQVEDIIRFLSAWHPDCIVADAGYGKDRNARMLGHFKERFFACDYPRTEDTTTAVLEPRWAKAEHRVVVHRSTALRQTAYQYRHGEIIVPCRTPVEPQLKVFMGHFENCQVVRDEEDDGRLTERVENSGPDHYVHADTYARLAMGNVSHKNRMHISM